MARLLKRASTAQGGATARSRPSGHAGIAAVLGSEILSGVRAPGSRLPSPKEMFELFGVSRVVLREVTKTLAAKGMVASKTKVGTLVTEASSWNWLDPDVLAWRMALGLDDALLRQVGEVRSVLEPAAAMLAAQRASKKDAAIILAAVRAMRAAAGDRKRFAQADYAFHAAVAAASGNPLLSSLTAIVDVVLSAFLAHVPASPPAVRTYERSIVLHTRVAQAIVAGSPASARKAMEAVVRMGSRDIVILRGGRKRSTARV